MNSIIVIPVRMNSIRFPGKPLCKIAGNEMVNRIFDLCMNSNKASQVYVATCDQDIKECVENYGGNVVMTSDLHERASDRVAEAVTILEKKNDIRYSSVVMVQGDEPLVNSEDIDLSIKELEENSEVDICNIMCQIDNYHEFSSNNVVKVATDNNNFALLMSRSAIPYIKKDEYMSQGLKQTGVIGFKRDALDLFFELSETSIEKIESIDMMRMLQHGRKIKMILSKDNYIAVDVIEDLDKVIKYLECNLYEKN